MTPLLIKSFIADAAVAPHTIVKATATDFHADTASNNEDALRGVADAMGADAGKTIDVTQAGWGEVRAGGTFAYGDPLTTDAQGRAIKAVPTVGRTIRTVGFAMSQAIENDIVPAHIVPGVIHTP